MLSIEQCRVILGCDSDMGDGELERLRDGLYEIATGLVELYVHTMDENKPRIPNDGSRELGENQ